MSDSYLLGFSASSMWSVMNSEKNVSRSTSGAIRQYCPSRTSIGLDVERDRARRIVPLVLP